MGRRAAPLLGAALLSGLLMAALAPSWRRRVAVVGHSMEPLLEDGDWLLVDPGAYSDRPPHGGDLVVAHDPRDSRRLIVKRVLAVADDGRLALSGDHPAHANDADRIGAVNVEDVVGRPWLLYWPPHRFGLLTLTDVRRAADQYDVAERGGHDDRGRRRPGVARDAAALRPPR